MWNSLHIIILPAVLLNFVPDTQKNTYLGLLTFFGLVIAMVVQPASGSLSDRWVSPWGRRRPLILIGTLFDFLFLAFLGWSGGLLWIAAGYIGLQFSSNIAHGSLQGLVPDKVPPEQLGWASGFKNLLDMSGLVAASLLVGRLLDPETRQPAGVIGLVAAVLAFGALITLLGARERPALPLGVTSPKAAQRLLPAALDALRRHPAFAWLILSRFFFLVGIYGIQVFAQYYVRDVLEAANPVQVTGDLLATITLALIAFSLLGGWLGDRIGHRRLQGLAGVLGALGCVLLLWARTPAALMLFGSVVGVGIGLFLTGNWALANQEAPVLEAGLFLGLTNLATAGAGAFGRLEGPFIDLLNNLKPGAWWGYSLLFIFGAFCMLFSTLLLKKVPAYRQKITSTADSSRPHAPRLR
jgi:MFS family permease